MFRKIPILFIIIFLLSACAQATEAPEMEAAVEAAPVEEVAAPVSAPPLVIQGRVAYTQKAENGSEIWISAISPQGSLVAYQSEHQQVAYWPRWSHDGNQIAYLVQDDDQENSFWLLDVNRELSRQLTPTGLGQVDRFCWTSDNRGLIWAASRSGASEMDLFHLDLKSGTQLILTEDTVDWSTAPDCSSVSAGIVYTSDRVWKENQVAQVDNLWLTYADGSYTHQLTLKDTCENQNPAFSPDGLQIAFFRTYYPDQIGQSGVWTIATDGAWEKIVADIPDLVTGVRKELAWSPDGSWLAYLLGSEGEETAIYLVASQGGIPQQLVKLAGKASGLSWLPNSSGIIYTYDYEEVYQLYVLGIDEASPGPLFEQSWNFGGEFAPLLP